MRKNNRGNFVLKRRNLKELLEGINNCIKQKTEGLELMNGDTISIGFKLTVINDAFTVSPLDLPAGPNTCELRGVSNSPMLRNL